MVRGFNMFFCDECHKIFIALDLEYMATVFSVPRKCPRCGSMHTMPGGICTFLRLNDSQREIYKEIWKKYDKAPL